jgi:hypothetical protein
MLNSPAILYSDFPEYSRAKGDRSMSALGNTLCGEYVGWCIPSAIIAERDIDDENFRGACRSDRRAPDLDAARHENVRPVL